MKSWITAAGLVALAGTGLGQPGAGAEPVRPRVDALRVEQGPRLDGVLEDPAWQQARWIEGLTQKDPVEGLPAAEPTRIALVYDEHSLYLAAELFTPLTGRIHTRMSPGTTWPRPRASSSPWIPTTTGARPTPSGPPPPGSRWISTTPRTRR